MYVIVPYLQLTTTQVKKIMVPYRNEKIIKRACEEA